MNWLEARLNADAKRWHALWSMRAAIFWAALNCAVGSLDFFAGTDLVAAHPLAFALTNMTGGTVIAIARIYKQPGLS